MLLKTTTYALAAGLLAAAAASSAAAAGPKAGDLKTAGPAEVSASPLYSLAALPEEETLPRGDSTLIRTNQGVAATINAANLEANAAYTVWWVIWNRPQECLERFACGMADLGSAGNVVFFATGRVTDDFGQATFTANLAYGDGTADLPPEKVMLPGALESRNAEIDVILRTHAGVEDLRSNGDLQAALNSLTGGCADDPRTPAPDDGPGEAACEDQFIAVHRR